MPCPTKLVKIQSKHQRKPSGVKTQYRSCVLYKNENVRNPFTGAVNNDYMSHDEDSATIHKMTTFGVCVLDPTRTMSFIPAILQG